MTDPTPILPDAKNTLRKLEELTPPGTGERLVHMNVFKVQKIERDAIRAFCDEVEKRGLENGRFYLQAILEVRRELGL